MAKNKSLEPGFQVQDQGPTSNSVGSAFAAAPALTPTLGRGMGHKPGTVLPASVGSTKKLFGARRSGLSGNVDFSNFVASIRDQAQTSRCVGAANARIINVRAQQLRGNGPDPTVPYPSERGLYSLAREEDRPTAQTPLVDQGSNVGFLLQAVLRDVGVPLERDFPEDDANINQEVPADVLAKAISTKVQSAHTIDSEGTARADDAVQSLLEGFCFSMAIPVGDGYESANSQSPVVAPAAGATLYGYHDVAIVGVKTVNGRRLFLNPGSWGSSFGFNGYVWLDESVLEDPRASDFVVMQVVNLGG